MAENLIHDAKSQFQAFWTSDYENIQQAPSSRKLKREMPGLPLPSRRLLNQAVLCGANSFVLPLPKFEDYARISAMLFIYIFTGAISPKCVFGGICELRSIRNDGGF